MRSHGGRTRFAWAAAVLCMSVFAASQSHAASQSSSLSRDASLDVPLLELLALPLDGDDALDQKMESAVSQCRARGISGVVQGRKAAQSEEEETDAGERGDAQWRSLVEYCHRNRYVRHIRQKHRAREAATHYHSDSVHRQAVEALDAKDLDYQTFFETYAEKRLPLVVDSHQASPAQSIASVGLAEEAMDQFLAVCFDSRQRVAPLLLTNGECAVQLDKFQVPLITVNNYIPRTNVSTAAALLPTLISESAASPVSPAQLACPFDLHMLLVPVRRSVEFRLYESQFLPYALPVDTPAPDSSYREVSVGADGTAEGSVLSPAASLDRVEPVAGAALAAHEALFVPGGKYFAVLSGASQVLRFCFVDASNLNVVTQSLRVDALVSETAETLFASLQSPTFETSIARRPSPDDALWANYMLWPKEAKLMKRRDMVTATDGGGSDSGNDQGGGVPLSRRERLKMWQDDKRWARHIDSLTLPVPRPPVVVNTTRTAVTLRWQDLYERPKNDITAYGYEVRWKRDGVRKVGTSEGHDAADAASGAVNFTHKQLMRSAMPTLLFGDDFDGKDIEGVVRGLAADTSYSFSVRMYVGDNFGIESEATHSARTAPCSAPAAVAGVVAATAADSPGTCAAVRWLAPSDDGGRSISAYLFAIRRVHSPMDQLQFEDDPLSVSEHERFVSVPSTAVTRSGEWLSTSVCDQIPGQSVQMRVSAVNAIGASAWSQPSDPLVVASVRDPAASSAISTVRGRGDPAFLRPPGSSANDTTAHRRLPRAILSDAFQQLVVAAPDSPTESRFEVWAGHFSPRRFHVSSELVLADPLDASQPLRNGDAVRDRIVVVARGAVPFAFKLRHAQLAGALGVVLLDVDGKCARGFDQRCVPGGAKQQGVGFGASDRHPLWRSVHIPFALAASDASRQLLELLR